MEIDYLINGQGLAGSLLAWELMQRGKKVVIVDNGKTNASLVAAGLINPVTGIRFVKSINVDSQLPIAIDCYKQLSRHFRQTFYYEKNMIRILRNNKEIVACQKRLHQNDYQDYLASITPSTSPIEAAFSIIKQKHCGYLLTPHLLTALKKFFIDNEAYYHAEIKYSEINLTPILQWRNFQPKRIIFCEGHLGASNPWFSWLPFQLVKGEIITATSNKKITHNILNYGHWFIPLNNYQFRTGATFNRDYNDIKPSSKAKQTLLASLKQIYPNISIEQIDNHQAGVRPTTLDKQPFIGSHPKNPDLVIFNGFGAKGSLLIPWYCQHLCENLINNRPIPESSHILRYFSSYQKND